MKRKDFMTSLAYTAASVALALLMLSGSDGMIDDFAGHWNGITTMEYTGGSL